MASGAIAAGIIGGAMAAGGAGAAIRAARIQAKPRGVYYGGSGAALRDQRTAFAGQQDTGNALTAGGATGLTAAGGTSEEIARAGLGLMNAPGAPTGGASGMSFLDAYRPGEASALAARQAADQVARQNLGAASAGGALGMRNALYANAAMGQGVAQQAAVQTAGENQDYLAARVGQANIDRQAAQQAYAQRLAGIGLGANIAQGGNAQLIGASNALANVGQGQAGMYLNAQQGVDRAQLEADLNYEQRRQAERQRRSDRLWQLGGGLITGGGAIAAKGFGGGGGG